MEIIDGRIAQKRISINRSGTEAAPSSCDIALIHKHHAAILGLNFRARSGRIEPEYGFGYRDK